MRRGGSVRPALAAVSTLALSLAAACGTSDADLEAEVVQLVEDEAGVAGSAVGPHVRMYESPVSHELAAAVSAADIGRALGSAERNADVVALGTEGHEVTVFQETVFEVQRRWCRVTVYRADPPLAFLSVDCSEPGLYRLVDDSS